MVISLPWLRLHPSDGTARGNVTALAKFHRRRGSSHQIVLAAPFGRAPGLGPDYLPPVRVRVDGVRDRGVRREHRGEPGDLEDLEDARLAGHRRERPAVLAEPL